MKIIIPARFGSKGLPLKNRKLFKYTADTIPKEYKNSVWVTTDDDIIKELAKEYGFNVIDRPAELADDYCSTKQVMNHALDSCNAKFAEDVIMLYLTYPQRTWNDIELAYQFFKNSYTDTGGKVRSLLCRKEIQTSPYLYLEESGKDGLFGKQLKPHDLYRRQDYPTCFEISHFISIFIVDELQYLNNNLYNDSTIFYKINNIIDVDYQADLIKLNGKDS